MRRRTVAERPDWRERFEEMGFSFHSLDGTYWREGVYYEFSAEEIDALEEASAELHGMCLTAVDHVLREDRLTQLGIPAACAPLIRASWARRDPSLYGRFDLAYDDQGGIKLLEYNADTPTSLFESAIAQWVWLEETFPQADQFNSLHEKLEEAFTKIKSGMTPPGQMVHFACVSEHEEDLVTTEYLRDVAAQAGIQGKQLFMEDIGFDSAAGRFRDLEGEVIQHLFKLYPWEWLLADDFGAHLLAEPMTTVLEPAWKIVLSSKGILAILWELFSGHPNLLPSSLAPLPAEIRQVKKPLFSREGANIAILHQGRVEMESAGSYGEEGFVHQAYQELPRFDGQHALVGSWIIDHRPAGIGIREDISPITKNLSTFVPHLFQP